MAATAAEAEEVVAASAASVEPGSAEHPVPSADPPSNAEPMLFEAFISAVRSRVAVGRWLRKVKQVTQPLLHETLESPEEPPAAADCTSQPNPLGLLAALTAPELRGGAEAPPAEPKAAASAGGIASTGSMARRQSWQRAIQQVKTSNVISFALSAESIIKKKMATAAQEVRRPLPAPAPARRCRRLARRETETRKAHALPP